MIFSLITALNDGQNDVKFVMALNASDANTNWWVSLSNKFRHVPSPFVYKGVVNIFIHYLCHSAISAFIPIAGDVTVVCASIVSFANLIINN